jgi:hypothetical protein
VLVVPVDRVPSTVLAGASCSPGDCAVIRPSLDTPASVVSEGAAALLDEFRVPQTVPHALRRLARAYDLEPEAIADDALPLIQQLVDEGLLIAEDLEDRHAQAASGAAARLLGEVLERVGPGGSGLTGAQLDAPTASVAAGAAGIAYMLVRIARIHGEPALVEHAGRWLDQAEAEARRPRGFLNPGLGLTADSLGQTSPYHALSGIAAVRALMAQALGDARSRQMAIQRFVGASQPLAGDPDLTLGRCGTVLVSALLLEALPMKDDRDRSLLLDLGDRALRSTWQQVAEFAPIQQGSPGLNLGIAHGWAGVLYATLLWHLIAACRLPEGALERLKQLAACADPVGRGARWKLTLDAPGARRGVPTPGWCNGSAGFVHLWTLAFRVLGEPEFLVLAEQAAWNAWQERWASGVLCCGLAGQAYALLSLYHCTGANDWLERARVLADLAAARLVAARSEPADLRPSDGISRWSLYRGDVGVALLAADLEHPDQARMPFFEPESQR